MCSNIAAWERRSCVKGHFVSRLTLCLAMCLLASTLVCPANPPTIGLLQTVSRHRDGRGLLVAATGKAILYEPIGSILNLPNRLWSMPVALSTEVPRERLNTDEGRLLLLHEANQTMTAKRVCVAWGLPRGDCPFLGGVCALAQESHAVNMGLLFNECPKDIRFFLPGGLGWSVPRLGNQGDHIYALAARGHVRILSCNAFQVQDLPALVRSGKISRENAQRVLAQGRALRDVVHVVLRMRSYSSSILYPTIPRGAVIENPRWDKQPHLLAKIGCGFSLPPRQAKELIIPCLCLRPCDELPQGKRKITCFTQQVPETDEDPFSSHERLWAFRGADVGVARGDASQLRMRLEKQVNSLRDAGLLPSLPSERASGVISRLATDCRASEQGGSAGCPEHEGGGGEMRDEEQESRFGALIDSMQEGGRNFGRMMQEGIVSDVADGRDVELCIQRELDYMSLVDWRGLEKDCGKVDKGLWPAEDESAHWTTGDRDMKDGDAGLGKGGSFPDDSGRALCSDGQGRGDEKQINTFRREVINYDWGGYGSEAQKRRDQRRLARMLEEDEDGVGIERNSTGPLPVADLLKRLPFSGNLTYHPPVVSGLSLQEVMENAKYGSHLLIYDDLASVEEDALVRQMDVEDTMQRAPPPEAEAPTALRDMTEKRMIEIFQTVYNHPDAEPFKQPVTKRQAPDYRYVVKKPMALANVNLTLCTDGYPTGDAFLSDMDLIFRNAMQYNLDGSVFYNMASRLQRLMWAYVYNTEGETASTQCLQRSSQASTKSSRSRTKPNILITGTPGVGKSETARAVCQLLLGIFGGNVSEGALLINVGDEVRRRRLGVWNETDQCFDIDEDAENLLLDLLEDKLAGGGRVVEYHSCGLFPERWFDLVVVLSADIDILQKRLEARQYSASKVEGNVYCEILQSVAEEAKESYKQDVVRVMSSNQPSDLERNVRDIVDFVLAWEPQSADNASLHHQSANLTKEEITAGPEAATGNLTEEMWNVFNQVFKHQDAPVFKNPVTKKEAPDYHKVISKPMALSNIRKKLQQNGYASAGHFLDDMDQIWHNAVTYNQAGSIIHTMAVQLQKYVWSISAGLIVREELLKPRSLSQTEIRAELGKEKSETPVVKRFKPQSLPGTESGPRALGAGSENQSSDVLEVKQAVEEAQTDDIVGGEGIERNVQTDMQAVKERYGDKQHGGEGPVHDAMERNVASANESLCNGFQYAAVDGLDGAAVQLVESMEIDTGTGHDDAQKISGEMAFRFAGRPVEEESQDQGTLGDYCDNIESVKAIGYGSVETGYQDQGNAGKGAENLDTIGAFDYGLNGEAVSMQVDAATRQDGHQKRDSERASERSEASVDKGLTEGEKGMLVDIDSRRNDAEKDVTQGSHPGRRATEAIRMEVDAYAGQFYNEKSIFQVTDRDLATQAGVIQEESDAGITCEANPVTILQTGQAAVAEGSKVAIPSVSTLSGVANRDTTAECASEAEPSVPATPVSAVKRKAGRPPGSGKKKRP